MKRRHIIGFAHHPWDEPEWMNRQQLLSRLGRIGWHVTYSDGALDWWQRGTDRWKQSPLFNTTVLRDGIVDTLAGKTSARWRKSRAYDRFALARFGRFLRRSANARPSDRVIVMLFDPAFYPYVEHLQPCDVIFHAYDDYAGQSGWNREKEIWLSKLVETARLVTASSSGIATTLRSDKVRLLPNGADVEKFRQAENLPIPSDLAEIPTPRLGYVGAINRKVDLKIIAEIAALRPDWHWVLVGRIETNELRADPVLSAAFSSCLAAPNVHFLGQKNRDEVPAYVGHMSVNTMTYRTDGSGWWHAIYPLKLHEYLATGLPVISTPVESVLPFQPAVRCEQGVGDWIIGLSESLAEKDRALYHSRVEIASQNSWDARVSLLVQWLNDLDA